MRLLPSGTTAFLVEVDDLFQVLALHAALAGDPPAGVVDLVPAARTVLVVVDTATTDVETAAAAVRRVRASPGRRPVRDAVELPVVYDGPDLDDVAALLRCSTSEVVRRHTSATWTVAFCGFAPGFGYLTCDSGGWDVARRETPRPAVPAGSVGLAGPFTGVYPRESPGGWRLIGRTDVPVFDLDRESPALLAPGTPVRFVHAGPA